VARANGKRAWEWRYVNPATGLYESKYFSGQEFPTEQDIEKHLGPFRLRLNSGQTEKTIVDPTFGDLLDAYIAEENLIEIKSRRPGDQSAGKDELGFEPTTFGLWLLKSRHRQATRITDLHHRAPRAIPGKLVGTWKLG
jgi:hypothetical protein